MIHHGQSVRMLRPKLLAWSLLGILLAVTFTGCDSLLEIEDNPTTIDADNLSGPAAFNVRFFGAQSDFITAVDLAALLGGLFTDEVEWGGSFLARAEIDRRAIRTSNDIVGSELYTGLQIAAATSQALRDEMLEGVLPQIQDPPNSAEFARISLFSGYARLHLADLFCTLAFGGTGPELESQEVYEIAIKHFTDAIEAANATPQVRNAALVGRARARLQVGQREGALEDTRRVEPAFDLFLSYSTNSAREENDLFNFTWDNQRLTIAPDFRQVTLDATGIPDPRVDVIDTGGTTFNGNLELWVPNKYPTAAAPLRLASWVEAQYMIAEIEGGAVARDIINDLRQLQGIDVVFDPGPAATEEGILRKVAEERARSLFLEGQRMGQLRRYLDQYGINLFPETEGDQTCMPLPDLERDNNPDI